MLLCIRLCALRFVLVCALTFVLSDVCSHVLSYVLPYALICVLSFVLVNLHSHICALVCILSYLCSHLCAPSFLPRDAMFHLFLFTLFGVPCRCNFFGPPGWQDARNRLCGRAGETSSGTGAALQARSQAAGVRALARGDNEVAEERNLAVHVRPGPSREGQERSREGALGREGEEPAPTPSPTKGREGGR